jgi:hypothetical protein
VEGGGRLCARGMGGEVGKEVFELLSDAFERVGGHCWEEVGGERGTRSSKCALSANTDLFPRAFFFLSSSLLAFVFAELRSRDDNDEEVGRLLSRYRRAERSSSFLCFPSTTLNEERANDNGEERKKHAFGLQGTTECKTRDRTRVGEGEKGREGRRWEPLLTQAMTTNSTATPLRRSGRRSSQSPSPTRRTAAADPEEPSRGEKVGELKKEQKKG